MGSRYGRPSRPLLTRYADMLVTGDCMPVALPSGWKPARLQAIERSTALTILLFILTCGCYGFYWTYRVHEEHPRRPGDPSGGRALLHIILPCVVAIPLLVAGKVRPDAARQAGMLPVWWSAMLLVTYANVAYAYIGWRLTGRFHEMWLFRDGENAATMNEGALSLFIAIGIWVSRNLVEGLEESGVPVPGLLLKSHTQAILRGLSIGFAFRWWFGIQKSANAFSLSPDL